MSRYPVWRSTPASRSRVWRPVTNNSGNNFRILEAEGGNLGDDVGVLESTAYRPYRALSAKIAQLARPDESWHGDALMVEFVLDAMFELAGRKVVTLPVSSMQVTIKSTGHRRKRKSKALD